jgi:hypothetical protein
MAEHQNIDELLAKYLAEESPEEDFRNPKPSE